MSMPEEISRVGRLTPYYQAPCTPRKICVLQVLIANCSFSYGFAVFRETFKMQFDSFLSILNRLVKCVTSCKAVRDIGHGYPIGGVIVVMYG